MPNHKPIALLMILLVLFPSAFARIPEDSITQPDAGAQDPVDDDLPEPYDPDDETSYQFPVMDDAGSAQKQAVLPTTPPLSFANPIAVDTGKLSVERGQFTPQLFSGAATFSYPIELPPGINGLAPSLSISYNHHQTTRAGVLGHGWDISTDVITRDTKGTRSDTSDDEFYLTLNGATMKLVLGQDGYYHTEQETFIRIIKNTHSDSWSVTVQDGTRYLYDTAWKSTQEPYASFWYLSETRSPHHNVIYYEHSLAYGLYDQTDVGVYLRAIKYNNLATEVEMEYTFGEHVAFDGYRSGTYQLTTALLRSITVRHDGNVLRKYHFAYDNLISGKFLNSIQEEGKDGQKLPPVQFTYNRGNNGWEPADIPLPPGIAFGTTVDEGVRLVDVSGDGKTDIVRSKGNAQMEYWENTKDGWVAKPSIQTPFSSGIIDALGNDQGVRFTDINQDARPDMLQLLASGIVARNVLENTGNGWRWGPQPPLPDEIRFIEQKSESFSCTPAECPAGTLDEGMTCDSVICTRQCSVKVCGESGTEVHRESRIIYWDDDEDYEEDDYSWEYLPRTDSCFRFEYTGSDARDSGDRSECYDLYSDNVYRDSYSRDCDGHDIDAYGAIGFISVKKRESWLKTIPPGERSGFTYSQDSDAWSNRFIAAYERDSAPDSSGNDKGDFYGFSDVICKEGGTYAVYCAPSASSCTAWGKNNCGYGCIGDQTGPFVTMGIYREGTRDIRDAFDDREPECSAVIDDNQYNRGNDVFVVTEYPVIATQYSNQICAKGVVQEHRDGGILFVDVDGDGSTDIVKGSSVSQKTWIRKGQQYIEDSAWSIPPEAVWVSAEGKDLGVRIADMNGDGLPDLVKAYEGSRAIWINTGKGWTRAAAGSMSIPDTIPVDFIQNGRSNGVQIIDVNNDGMADVLSADSLGNAMAWIRNIGPSPWLPQDSPLSSWKLPQGISFADYSATLADINGDGMPDIISAPSASSRQVYLNRANSPLLLSFIKHQYGGGTQIQYKNMASFDHTGGDGISDLPFAGWVVSYIRTENEMPSFAENRQTTIETRTFDYANGLYNAEEKEFLGFGRVEEMAYDAAVRNGRKVTHYFHQSLDRKGREYQTDVIDTAQPQRPLAKTEYTWQSEDKGGYYIVSLKDVTERVYNQQSAYVTTRASYQYDQYGNVAKISYDGTSAATGDERYVSISYAYNTNAWIVDKPYRIISYAADGSTMVQSTIFAYDGRLPNDPPIKGDVTKEDHTQLPGTNAVFYYAYDQFGNVVAMTNPNGQITRYQYDATSRFPIQVTNAKGQVYRYEYDVSGNLLGETDPNGFQNRYSYDGFGRIAAEIRPGDTAQYPTAAYSYSIDGTPPEQITVRQRERSGADVVYETHYFYDGYGRMMQVKSEGPQWITQDVHYDEFGRTARQSVPYFIASPEYTQPMAVSRTEFVYDYLDRVVEVKNPDNGKSTIRYDLLTTAVVDENGHRREYTSDAYGNIVAVKEFNGNTPYNTYYLYDALDNLLSIQDNQNNRIRYSYAMLGQRIRMEDPDLGTWTYEYDQNGNIMKQTDANGNVVQFTYDALDRLTSKGNIRYYYDERVQGTLSRVETPDVQTQYEYDNRLRKTQEKTSIDGKTFIHSWAYDAADRVIREMLPNGEVIAYDYDVQGNVASIRSCNALADPSGCTLQQASRLDAVATVEHNEAGLPVRRAYANGRVTDLVYDQAFRPIRIMGAGLQDMNYFYDKVGNVLTISNLISRKDEKMQYDPLDRLVSASRTDEFSIQYQYDSIGNMLRITAGTPQDIEIQYSRAHAPSRVSFTQMANRPPILDPIGDKSVEEGKLLEFTVTGSDPENVPLVFSAVNLPPGASFQDQKFLWSPQHHHIGEYKVNFAVYDGVNAMNTEITIRVTPIPARFTVSLGKGWNIMSFPLSTQSKAVEQAFASVQGKFSYVAFYVSDGAAGSWLYYQPGQRKDFSEVRPGAAYFILMNEPSQLAAEGIPISAPISISLRKGANVIGSPFAEPKPITEFFGPAWYSLDSIFSMEVSNGNYIWKSYYQQAPPFLNDFTTIDPGKGYWVMMNKDVSLEMSQGNSRPPGVY